MIAVPLAQFLIVAFLYTAFNSGRLALLILRDAPIDTIRGSLALWLRGIPFSISAGTRFIALFGIAVMNSAVLIGHIRLL